MLVPYTPLFSLRSAAIDTETTGLDLATARIVQIAVLPMTGARRENETVDVLIDPQIPMPETARRIHGISDTDIRGKPAFAEVFGTVEAALRDRVVIGYNTGFDLALLEKECRLAGLPWIRPRSLDVRFLARLVSPQLANDSLEALCEWLGVTITNRHTAMGDAEAAAGIYSKLIPHLRERGVRTLGEAEAACRDLLERAANAHAQSGQGFQASATPFAAGASADAKPDRIYLQLDSYPYRHRIRDVMRKAVFAPATLPLEDAAQLMIDRKISAVLIEAEGGPGIVTERDLLWALARERRDGTTCTIGEVMNRPLQSVAEDDFVYRAIGRMDRLKIRHLAVVDATGALTGIVSARGLLRQRATSAIALGDEIDRAPDLEALGLARAKLAAVAKSLQQEDLGARTIAEVISAEVRALNARAAGLAEEWMRDDGRGPPPCPYALLVLGSAGRGESLLSADQDNALVLARCEPGSPDDAWFAAFATKLADILDAAGVPYCKGGVMAKNPAWRHSVEHWRKTVDGWLTRSRPQDILDVDIFFDARAVHGDQGVAQQVIDYAFKSACAAPGFLKLLSQNAREVPQAFTLWGGLRADETGRIDVKRLGLMPIFTGARVLALRLGVRARTTPDRLNALKGTKGYADSEIDSVVEAHAALFSAVLDQQMADIEKGVPPSARVEVARLDEPRRRALKRALTDARRIGDLVGEGMIA